jgi:hypothetical protein
VKVFAGVKIGKPSSFTAKTRAVVSTYTGAPLNVDP